MPYTGTPLEEKLKAEGRVREKDFNADYHFLGDSLFGVAILLRDNSRATTRRKGATQWFGT